MPKYRVTIPLKYRPDGETHPIFPSLTGGHHVMIDAPDFDMAHNLAFAVLGEHWAFLYPEETYEPPEWAPPTLLGMTVSVRDLSQTGYSVGDPDPYPGYQEGSCRGVSSSGFLCTAPDGHGHPHIASNGSRLVDVWA